MYLHLFETIVLVFEAFNLHLFGKAISSWQLYPASIKSHFNDIIMYKWLLIAGKRCALKTI